MQKYRKEQNNNTFGQTIKQTTSYYSKRVIFSGAFVTVFLILLQMALTIGMFVWFSNYTHFYFEGSVAIAIVAIVMIMNEDSNPAYKITWLVPVALFPIVGTLLYLYVKFNIGTRAPKKVLRQIVKETKGYIGTTDECREKIEKNNPYFATMSYYLEQVGGHATYENSSIKYYSLGDYVMEDMLEALRSAKEFIFMEFFMIEKGVFFDRVLEILEEKVKAGVEVRLMYDDIGCVLLLPRNFTDLLRKKGIQARTFAHIKPFFSTHYNNRDHRKILVVDGKVAFTGGINLCDEYVNACVKYGHWKDNVVKIKGEAVKGFTVMFLQMWHAAAYEHVVDYAKYLETYPVDGEKGYLIPYGDGPYQKDCLAENVYMDILYQAKKYVYIMTPYLILDHELELAITHAAKSGVDVRIILPHIPDKKIPFMIARSYYIALLEAGVKIYEYEPGFIHSKTFLSDDIIGTVGSVNLDYRSLYLHYECGLVIYEKEQLQDIKKDFSDTIEKCIMVDEKYYKAIPVWKRFIGRVLRIFGPLM